jgi:DNA-binding LacI/PurR family transcriptional regulator
MDEIAARAGVSRGTVSLALRRSPKISATTTERVFNVARELGYRPNVNASRLARADFSTFGVVVSDLHNPIIAEIIDSFFLNNPQVDSETYLATGFNNLERERAAIESFLSHRVKGLVLVGSLLPDAEIAQLARLVPTILIGRDVEGLDCVLVDDAAGGRLVADHLIGLDHRSFGHIDGGTGAGAVRRKSSFVDTVRAKTGTDVTVVPGDYSQESGYEGARLILDRADRPSAIFAANDLMALGVMGAARSFGLTAGEDFALVGFDNMSLAAYDFVSLTTVSYSREDMGRVARELLKVRCSEPSAPKQTVKLVPTLVSRNTTGVQRQQGM